MEKMNYRISSRATILLGRESVSKVDGAIIELVKNTYDADASVCYICFDLENDKIYLLDNGVGMTRSIVNDYWMMIGTNNKKVDYVSTNKRIKSGEKGIGRFALDRLGNKCRMFTKHESEKLISWTNDWSQFEQDGKLLNEIEADFEYLNHEFYKIIPDFILKNIHNLASEKKENFNLLTGTLFEISGLRDIWTKKDVNKLVDTLGFSIPPTEQLEDKYYICLQKTPEENYVNIENEAAQEYDYKIWAEFNGDKFNIKLDRNEFDINKMPSELFANPRFTEAPYRLEDFKKQIIIKSFSVQELTKNNDPQYVDIIKGLGKFSFVYSFMKLSSRDDGNTPYCYKQINSNRKLWLNQHGGIKIYRDGFVVRPYGDINSNAFDWLSLDARKGNNPVAVSHKSGQWHVNNSQGQGTVFISRVFNNSILDKSSREGIIENEYFEAFSEVLKSIISVFEQDRAYVIRTMKLFFDDINEKEKAKNEAAKLAETILNNKKQSKDQKNNAEQTETLAKAVKYYEEERDELISEIRLLRALATNGLLTTSMVHDLKSIGAILVSRVESIKWSIDTNNNNMLDRNLNDLLTNDTFLKSWISVITKQANRDRRRRLKKDVYFTIKESIDMIQPILDRKKVYVEFSTDENEASRRIFETDFDSIIYNLVINSIESFEISKCMERIITVKLECNDDLIIHYSDNGKGLTDSFLNNPYDIFNYGTTSKYDAEGNQLGTGLGMYIVASSINEYNGKYIITKKTDGFGLDIYIPMGGTKQ